MKLIHAFTLPFTQINFWFFHAFVVQWYLAYFASLYFIITPLLLLSFAKILQDPRWVPEEMTELIPKKMTAPKFMHQYDNLVEISNRLWVTRVGKQCLNSSQKMKTLSMKAQ